MNSKKPSTPSTWTEPDDAPVLGRAFFAGADVFQGKTLKRRAGPKAAPTKEPVKIRLDAAVFAALRGTGEGWQTRIKDALRASLQLAGRN
jgi:uncharacterized protein (DUF4415 family)